MTTPPPGTRQAVLAATLVSLAMIAFQIAAKATRDALFLSSFDVAALPAMIMVTAAFSIGLAFGIARWMSGAGPRRTVPVLFAASAGLLVIEWWLIEPYRRAVSIALYLHYGGLGAVLISGFWSLVNERFDPRTAKREIGRIVTAGTVGGLLGGVLAERAGAWATVELMLPLLAGVHAACAWLLRRIGPPPGSRRPAISRVPGALPGLRVIAGSGYLLTITALVLLTTVGEGLIDYVFKARATASLGRGEELLRLFAVFYTGISLLSILIQTMLARPAFRHLGLARTGALLPTGVVVGGVGALVLPGLVSALAARGLEAVVRNSLYRPAYELLFAPVRAADKRAAKTLIDVGVVRLGDLFSGSLVQAVLFAVSGATLATLLGIAVAFGVAAGLVCARLHRGYLAALERSLRDQAHRLDLADVDDLAVRTTLLQTIGVPLLTTTTGLPAADDLESSSESGDPARVTPLPIPVPRLDPEAQRLLDLRSADPERVKGALAAEPVAPSIAADVIRLLAWDAVTRDAIAALRPVASKFTGQLVDHLLDPEEEFAIRRRIPLVLAACPTPRAVDGLLSALDDARFEVRYRAGRALTRIHDTGSEIHIDPQRIVRAVLHEVTVDRGVWESYRLLDRGEDEDWSPMLDELVRDRANRGLEHVFTMLALVLPREPLRIAFHGLYTDDPHLRGTALEYLETALPAAVRTQLWPFLEDNRSGVAERRPSSEIVADLLQSRMSIQLNLEQLRKKPAAG